jgi:hypothetical protein
MNQIRGRAAVNVAGDALVVAGFALVIWGLWSWSQPLALVVGGIGLITVGYTAAVK